MSILITWPLELKFKVGDKVRLTSKEPDDYSWTEGVIESIGINPPQQPWTPDGEVWYRFRASRGRFEGELGGFPADCLELVHDGG